MSCFDSNNSKRKRDHDGPHPILEHQQFVPETEEAAAHKKQRLHIRIPTSPPNHTSELSSLEDIISGLSEPNSLFDSPTLLSAPSTAHTGTNGNLGSLSNTDRNPAAYGQPALRTAPPIPGLFFDPDLRISQDLADEVVEYCMKTYFHDKDVNQVMLFERAPSSSASAPVEALALDNRAAPSLTGLPPVLVKLLSVLESELSSILPENTYLLLFPQEGSTAVPSPNTGRARQAIINLYHPGEGITAHVDLLKRFGDGIIGASFGSGCAMQFACLGDPPGADKPTTSRSATDTEKSAWNVYLPERSVIVLSEDARYRWTHGIGKHRGDLVRRSLSQDSNKTITEYEWISRGTRLSVTFRWLLPGAEIVGKVD